MKNIIQPNVAVLKWARESAGYTIQDVAEKLRKTSKKITTQTIIDFEKGSAFPTYSQMDWFPFHFKKYGIKFSGGYFSIS